MRMHLLQTNRDEQIQNITSLFRYQLYAVTRMEGQAHFVSYFLGWKDRIYFYDGVNRPQFREVKRMELGNPVHLIYVMKEENKVRILF